jgi:hypothetical protein|tara:strand:+ start:163 stop:450 length:288 start_codon:yes stop_codon:yes gene_type:complete
MAKSDSKFRQVIINKKKYFFYEIRWIDVFGESGHAEFKEFAEMKPAYMTTNAYIFKRDKSFIWTFSSYDERDEVFSDRNIFPVGVIKTLTRVEKA